MDSSSSPPPAIDSTRRLLQDLRLRGAIRLGKHMDAIETDFALEVPDTPERATVRLADEDDGGNATRGRSYFHRGNLSLRGEGASSSNGVSNESLFRKGRLASLMPSPRDAMPKFPSGFSHPTKCRSARRRAAHDFPGERQSSHISRSIDSLSSPSGSTKTTRNDNSVKLSGDNQSSDLNAPQRLLHDGFISLGNEKREKVFAINEETSSSTAVTGHPDKGKGVYFSNDSSNKSKKASDVSNQANILPKNFGQRRLVRNGVISPANIAKVSNLTREKNEKREILSAGSEPRESDHAEVERTAQANHWERAVNAIANGELWPGDEMGWRSTRNHARREASPSPPRKDRSFRSPGRVSEDRSSMDSPPGLAASSSSSVQAVWDVSSERTIRGRKRHVPNLSRPERTVIDVDELPSPVPRRGGDSETDARAQQVISDEILARRLQEQFFNESAVFHGAEEIDAGVAWALQQEESARLSSLIPARSQTQRRDPSTAHLYRQYPLRRSSQSSRSNSTNNPRGNMSARMAQMRRNVRRGMDLETRLNILGALEVAFSVSDDPTGGVLHLHRDFNENDYEMLLALDDINDRRVGASVQQISSLPESVIQTDNVEEPCAICLDTPSVGDTIRHLPCLHKFHKDCIDEWLRRKTTCPICKSGIA